ncbi:MAG: tRNA epoxyqueuosine(34) reductase QueG, partial [Saprospiraceae bacterium]
EMALNHGFMGVGISKAERLDDEAKQLEGWLSKGYHGDMAYMANHFEMRVDPTKLVPGAKSVVSLMYNYYPGECPSEISDSDNEKNKLWKERMSDTGYRMPDSTQKESIQKSLSVDSFKISKYAYGEDYHKVVRRKLKELVAELKKEVGDFHGRVFVDSAPVMERDWAKRSGQGWIGKNTLLIHPKKGSYFFLAEIILDVELDYDHPIRDHCGTCTKCIDACPTEAISPAGYILDGSKCISYLTIELKSKIPDEFKGKMEDWIFGCDICQEVCPWNRFSKPHHEPAFEMDDRLKEYKKQDWLELTAEVFDSIFEKSPVKRTGFEGLKRNIGFVQN